MIDDRPACYVTNVKAHTIVRPPAHRPANINANEGATIIPFEPRLKPPLVAAGNGLQVASLLDLAGMKAKVVLQRAEAKDYLDIDALLTSGDIDLPTALASARAIHGKPYSPQSTLKALSYFGDGNLHQLPACVKERLAKAAREVDLDRLPVIAVPAKEVSR